MPVLVNHSSTIQQEEPIMRNRPHGMFGAVGSLVIASVSLLGFNAEAAIVHNEAVHGDLSDDHASPTTISLAIGDNLILGSTTHLPVLDRDFFTITIPDGHSLDAIVLANYTNTDANGFAQSFFSWTKGSHFRGMGFTDVSGWILIGAQPGLSAGDDLLVFLTGGPLGPGTYSFWHQETEGDTTYTFNYRVSAVPLPDTLALLLSGLTFLGTLGTMVRKRLPLSSACP
ncbi:MAG: hypothetical protein NNA30_12445 [Nitrospira sp.]|nr:hypothetical protein [Nitrospira sp.]